MSGREKIRKLLPFGVVTAWRSFKLRFRDGVYLTRRDLGAGDVFDRIYEKNAWASAGSVSGPGSERRETEDVRALLPPLLARLGVGAMLDAPCGDFAWMREVDLGGCDYVGGDIVAALVAANGAAYGGPRRKFLRLDVRSDPIPKVDLIFCRDCLIHLSFPDGLAALANFRRSGAAWLLTTTHPDIAENLPIRTGDYRPVDLMKPPYRLPPPVEIHRDRYAPAQGETLLDPGKSLGLWRLADFGR
jgi:hypothetical protein